MAIAENELAVSINSTTGVAKAVESLINKHSQTNHLIIFIF